VRRAWYPRHSPSPPASLRAVPMSCFEAVTSGRPSPRQHHRSCRC